MAKLVREKIDATLIPRPGSLRLTDGKLSDLTLTYLRGLLVAAIDRINGALSLGTGRHGTWSGNIDGQYVDVVARAANAEFPVPHGLGRVPVGYIVVRTNGASVLYDNGGGNWTDTTMYLRCTDAGTTIRILIF